ERSWRPLEEWELANLAAPGPATGRGAHWPLDARLRGRVRRLLRRPAPLSAIPSADAGAPGGVLVPEIFSPGVAAALPALFCASAGPRVALFHDAIALQLPQCTPKGTVERFPAYLRELLQFDGVAAVSEDSREALVDYWRWLGAQKTPVVAAVTLGIDAPPPAGDAPPAGGIPTVLCVGSIEARKNHAALLDACESLWSADLRFRLHLVGMANSETGGPALERIRALASAGRPLLYEGALPDDGLEAAYCACAFTVYPSLAEGFGLPVAESLARGKPCLCRTTGALGEVSRDGGCLGIGGASIQEIAAGIRRLLQSPAELSALAGAARGRRFKTWDEYCAELLGWMGTLRRAA
ncbi:MAG TPA: glycosyltransferase, partial [Opitutaceae bacterium]